MGGAVTVRSLKLRAELVSPVERTESAAQTGNVDFSSEAGESPQAVRERTQSEPCGQIECATADRPVTVPCIEDDVTVEQARWDTKLLVVVDVRSGWDLREIGGHDCAVATGKAVVRGAILRHMEVSVSLV